MSTFVLPRNRARAVLDGSSSLGLRPPSRIEGDGPPQLQTTQTLVYEPDLSPAEQALFDRLAANTIQADIQAIRDFRQLGRNAFMALPTDAERFRRLYDNSTAITRILLSLLREE